MYRKLELQYMQWWHLIFCHIHMKFYYLWKRCLTKIVYQEPGSLYHDFSAFFQTRFSVTQSPRLHPW